ncbi:MAG: ribose-phosphate pyrophosphokinase [Candidatus Hydrogenedentota bacterium]
MKDRPLKIFSGNSNPVLSQEICDYLKIPYGDVVVTQFSDGEISVKYNENIRGADVFIVQPTCYPANRNIMELLLMVDAAKRASAERITAVVPYFGYARQDRKDQPRVPISSKLIANLIVAAGTDRVLAMDLHADQIQGFFDIPVDHLYAAPVIIEYIKTNYNVDEVVIISPDAGGVERARAIASRLGCTLAIIDKRRPRANVSEVMNVIGEIEGYINILIDDIIDTAGTIAKSAFVLKERGAKKIIAACTHPVLSGNAIDKIEESPIEELIVTNTIPLTNKKLSKKITALSVASLLGEAIIRIHNNSSVSSLFI